MLALVLSAKAELDPCLNRGTRPGMFRCSETVQREGAGKSELSPHVDRKTEVKNGQNCRYPRVLDRRTGLKVRRHGSVISRKSLHLPSVHGTQALAGAARDQKAGIRPGQVPQGPDSWNFL